MFRYLAVVFAVLLAVTAARAGHDGGYPHTFGDGPDDHRSAEEGQRLLAVVAAAGNFRLLDGQPNEYSFGLADDAGRTVGDLHVRLGENDRMPRFRSRHFAMEIASYGAPPAIIDTLVGAARRVAESDGGALPSTAARFPREPRADLEDATLALIAVALLLGGWRRGRVTWNLRLPHLVPAAIQLLLFAYWSLYWPSIGAQAPSIALQVVMGFAADAAFAFACFGSWRIGASPLPIVLSTNLFAWFNPAGVVISIVTAFACKALLRRGESHVLNPSAIGLSTAGALTLIAPEYVHFGGLFHTMNLPPNMAELVLLLALLPQARFRVLPVSIGAVLALRALENPAVLRPPMLLVVALLATDPATTPRSDTGKVLFGVFLGFTMPLTSFLLRRSGYVDDFSKVMPIPIANALAPQFDRVGALAVSLAKRGRAAGSAWLSRRRPAPRGWPSRLALPPWLTGARPIPNLCFVATWLLLSVPRLGEEKPWSFEPALHWNLGTPLVVRDGDDVPRCAHNPVFCRPFTFVQELALWRARGLAR